MSLALLDRVLAVDPSALALVWRDRGYSFGWVLDEAAAVEKMLADAAVPRGAVVSLEADHSPHAAAALLALIAHDAIVVPLGPATEDVAALATNAELEVRVTTAGDRILLTRTRDRAGHPLYEQLREAGHPGLVLFSSGSEGRPKAAVHDLARLATRYERTGRAARICAFLALDHIGGVNTLLYTLVNGGCLAVPDDRSPDEVCRTIERHRLEVLPTTPTFLGLLLLSEVFERFDLSSLALITYGTEVMPSTTLKRLRAKLSQVRLLQTYGLSETGILATRSPESDSLWFAITAPEVETRIVDGVLHVRTPTTMLGYLDGEQKRLLPGGWFDTGDLVECRGTLIRVLGRSGDVINVGGEKVHPAQIENVVLELDGVVDARVSGEANAVTGQHVRLEVVLATDETAGQFRGRLALHCADKLEAFKIPSRIVVADRPLHGHRYKKVRAGLAARSDDDGSQQVE